MHDEGAPRDCIACGHAPRRTILLVKREPLWQCPRCGLAWWRWPALDARAFYNRDYFQSADAAKGYDDYAALEVGLRRTARARLRRIEALLAPGSHATGGRGPQGHDGPARSMLEIGCGTGLLLDEARRAGWRVAGVEVSEYATAEARRRGLAVSCAACEDAELPEAAYDCVALFDVVEHLRDPAGALRAAGRALRPGGVLAVSTGDVTSLCARVCGPKWHLYNLPEHLFFFSPRALEELMLRAGCIPWRTTREVNWVPVRYLVERLRKSHGGAARVLGAGPAAWLAQRFAQRVVPATLLDVMGMYAVRRGGSER